MIITGVSGPQTRKLADSLRSIRARIKGAYIKPGKTYSAQEADRSHDIFATATGEASTILRAGLSWSQRFTTRETNRTDIKYDVTKGRRSKSTGRSAHLGPHAEKTYPHVPGECRGPDLVNEGAQDLTSYFQSKGYFDAKVQSGIRTRAFGQHGTVPDRERQRGKVKAD